MLGAQGACRHWHANEPPAQPVNCESGVVEKLLGERHLCFQHAGPKQISVHPRPATPLTC